MNSFCCDCEFILSVISVVFLDISSIVSMIAVTNLMLFDVDVSTLSDDREMIDFDDFDENVKISDEYDDEIRYLMLNSKTIRFCLNFARFTNQSVSQIESFFVRERARCCLRDSSSELKLKDLTED